MAVDGWRLRWLADLLRSGGVLAYPTEGVYGLGCDPGNRDAVFEILHLKRRPVEKGLILVAADWAQLAPYLSPDLPDAARRRMQATWPGPHTWVAPASDPVPGWLTGYRTDLAVRVSAHPLVAALCRAFGGPLVSTSANPAGRPPATTALRARAYFPGRLDAVVSGALGGARGATPIRDALTGRSIR